MRTVFRRNNKSILIMTQEEHQRYMESKFIKYMELLANDFMLADQEYAYNRIKDDIKILTNNKTD